MIYVIWDIQLKIEEVPMKVLFSKYLKLTPFFTAINKICLLLLERNRIFKPSLALHSSVLSKGEKSYEGKKNKHGIYWYMNSF